MTASSYLETLKNLFSADNATALVKQQLHRQQQTIFAQFDPDHSVDTLLQQRSQLIDDTLSAYWKHILGDHSQFAALLAIGGYGRQEMFPHSDVDILILLTQETLTPTQTHLLEKFSSTLWDIGLKPGQSIRTLKECAALANDDQSVMTSIIESRLITGNSALLEQLNSQTTTDIMWSSTQYFDAKLKERAQRHNKFHDTAYNLEPNIKEGPGGLRDIQTFNWVFNRHYQQKSPQPLIDLNYLSTAEHQELIADTQILWRIRYALHRLTNKDENRLLFDFQRELAEQFGFEAPGNGAIEQFMQLYFKTVVGLERLNEVLLQLFQERVINTQDDRPELLNDDFHISRGYIEAIDSNLFNRSPKALLEVFLLCQQHAQIKDISAKTIRLIQHSLHLIDDEFRAHKESRRLFMEILKQPEGTTHQLRRMNRYGLLAAYLPCFKNIVSRMQYDLFHIHTVDEHTLFVIRNLRRFALNKHNHEVPFCNDIFLLISKPEVLYLAGLFHDIAKGRGGDHSVIGQDIAQQFCQDHALPDHDTTLIVWLVRHHLIMSTTAQHKDISDPEIIHTFAEQIGTQERLNHLYLLTVADIRATNPTLWNSWKNSLLKELYLSTNAALEHGLENPVVQKDHIKNTQNEAKNDLILKGIPLETIEKAWEHLDDNYFIKHSADEIIWHTIGIASIDNDNNNLPLVLLRPQTLRGSAEVFIFTRDDGPIFSVCTDILDQLGLSILDARITTTQNEYVLNSFHVLEQSGEPINNLIKEINLSAQIRNRLLNKNYKGRENINRLSRQAKYFPIKTQVIFHDDPKKQHTILELISTDSPGLLSKVGRIFQENNITLHNAKISTIGGRVEDRFYITDLEHKSITDPKKLNSLKNDLLTCLTKDRAAHSSVLTD
jgi:[protein-PII] uridylyltransferase